MVQLDLFCYDCAAFHAHKGVCCHIIVTRNFDDHGNLFILPPFIYHLLRIIDYLLRITYYVLRFIY